MFRNARWSVLAVAVLSIGVIGCRPGEEPSDSGGKKVSRPAKSRGQTEGTTIIKAPPPPPVPTVIPKVKLSKTQADSCRVAVGGVMPEGTLPQLGGSPVPLSSLYGKALTVVCFWKSDDLFAVAELGDLQSDVAGPFSEKDVQVIGINVGDPAPLATEKLRTQQATFPTLLDTNGEFFAKVATESLPRTYLLDAQGKILWFDIGYQRSTRRDLLQGIQVVLNKLEAAMPKAEEPPKDKKPEPPVPPAVNAAPPIHGPT